MARRRKPGKKRRGKGSTDSSSSIHNSLSSEHMDDVDALSCSVNQLDGEGELSRSRVGSEAVEEGDEDEELDVLRLPEMTDTSMHSVGQPLRDVMDRLNGALDREEPWEHLEEDNSSQGHQQGPEPPAQQPFREDSGGRPPDPAAGDTSPTTPQELCCFTPNCSDSAPTGGSCNDSTQHRQPQALSGGPEDEGETKKKAGQEPDMNLRQEDGEGETQQDTLMEGEEQQEKLSPSESSHPAEFKYEASSQSAVHWPCAGSHLMFFTFLMFQSGQQPPATAHDPCVQRERRAAVQGEGRQIQL